MQDESGDRVIVFNGEIYNLPELRLLLVQKGYRFRTQSDTEALLHLYDLEGDAMLGRLRGMFALAIWDRKQRVVLLARDPFGIKPLYFSDDGQTWGAPLVKGTLRPNEYKEQQILFPAPTTENFIKFEITDAVSIGGQPLAAIGELDILLK